MKRFAAAVLGFIWGVLWMCVTIRILSNINWHHEPLHSSGCSDMEHCSPRSVFLLSMASAFFTPALAFALLNAIAYKRWPLHRWAIVFTAGSIFLFALYLFAYAFP